MWYELGPRALIDSAVFGTVQQEAAYLMAAERKAFQEVGKCHFVVKLVVGAT